MKNGSHLRTKHSSFELPKILVAPINTMFRKMFIFSECKHGNLRCHLVYIYYNYNPCTTLPATQITTPFNFPISLSTNCLDYYKHTCSHCKIVGNTRSWNILCPTYSFLTYNFVFISFKSVIFVVGIYFLQFL